MYYPLFLLRRVIFVSIPTFLYLWPAHQIQLLIVLTSHYIVAYVHSQPHWDSKRVKVEVFNELMILLACYHIVCFSELNLDAMSKY